MKRLIVFDLEGTIFKANYKIDGVDFASTMWQLIAYYIDAVDKEKETHDKWEDGIYNNYGEWVDDTFKFHKECKLRKEYFNDVLEAAEYNEGVIEFFEALDRSQWVPVIISGGFQELVDKACKELNIKYGYGACRYIFDSETGFLERYSYDPCDFKGKFHKFKMIAEEENIRDGLCAFVGDGKNDEFIARKASIAFGINPHEKLKSIPGLIEINTFMDIFKHLDNVEEIAKEVKKKKHEKDKQIEIRSNEWPKDGKILIVGNGSITQDKILLIAKEYKLNNKIKYINGYKHKYDFNILKNNKSFSYLFLGQMDHSVKGKEDAPSIHSQINNNSKFYPKLYPNEVERISIKNIHEFFEWINDDKEATRIQ